MSLIHSSKPKASTPSSDKKDNFFGTQAKLNIGKSNDKYEKEADAMADKVVGNQGLFGSEPFIPAQPNSVQKSEDQDDALQQKPLADSITPLVQKKEEELQMQEEEEAVQMMEEEHVQTSAEEETSALSNDESSTTSIDIQQKVEEEIQEKEEEEIQEKVDEHLQKSADTGGDGGGGSNFENSLASSKGGGSPMDSKTQSGMESGFGTDFSGVRVHTDDNAVQMNQELGSQAFTNGNDIYFNEGKYNPSSKDGQHLLAHELTHTVQQGASTEPASVQKAEGEEAPAEPVKPGSALDITHRFELTDAWAKYLDALYDKGERKFEVDVKIGERFSGTIMVRRLKATAEGETSKYELNKSGFQKYLNINGWSFLDPLRSAGVTPILVLKNFGEEQVTTGFLSVKMGETPLLADVQGFIKGINENLEAMQFLGIEPINVDGLENTFESGRLIFQVSSLSTVIDGYLSAGGGMGIMGETFTFNLNANVDVAGLASGEFTVARGEDGKLSGTGDIEADIANVNAKIHVEYIDGAVTIQGTGRIESEKFSGEITLLVTDAAKSKQMMNAALGVETMDAEAESSEAAPTPKTKNNQVLAGWGEVTASITPWLEGTAKVGIDSEGHVTIVGEIVVPDEIELMEQRGKKVDIFSVEIRAGYGIPLVGQVFLFASIGMFMNAGFGPLVLKDVGFTGTYSTDPSVLQEFSVTGTLGINAFAILGLEAEAGVGVTILGHDVKAGVNVTAAAGLRAYAEATPTLEYKEQASPEGGKTGETRLKGHFEAAAQLFLQLTGALFVELDSPWWSPAPDGREEYPLGEVQYPIGDSMGIGADMDWLVGSPDIPEIKFSPVEFDADKFTADVMADPPPRKRGDSDANPEGEWVDGNKPGDQQENPEMKDGEGLPENGKKKEDLKNLPDEQKYMRALDEMSKLEKADPKPTFSVVNAKAKKVKSKYGLDKITVKEKGDEAEVFVKHKKQDNGKHLLMVPMMSEAERAKLLVAALDDLNKRSEIAADEGGMIEESAAKETLSTWHKAHPVVEDAKVVDGEKTWDYFVDLGDKSETIPGNSKKGAEDEAGIPDGENIVGLSAPVKADGGHTVKLEGSLAKIEIKVFSKPKSLNQLVNDKRIEIEKSKGMDPEYDKRRAALDQVDTLKKTLGSHVGEYKRAVDNAYTGGKKSEITTAYNNVNNTLMEVAQNLEIMGVEIKDWNRPESDVKKTMVNGMAKRVIAQPLTAVPGNSQGSAATSDPKGWDSIDVSLRKKGDWVRAHLLSHKLHGPGDQLWNLFPGTREMNLANMENQIESDAKERVNKGEVLFYNVVLTYGNSGTYDFIPTETYMEYGSYDSINKKRGEVYSRVTFKQQPPTGAAAATNDLNSSSAKSLDLVAKANGKSDMHGFFVNIAKGRKNGHKYSDSRVDKTIKEKMKLYYADGSSTLDRHMTNLEALLDSGILVTN